MNKVELFWLIFSISGFLQLYGILISVRIPRTGWGIKGILMVPCVVVPTIGWIFATIVFIIRYRMLKKGDAKKKNASDITPSGYLHYRRLFSFSKEVVLILVSFIIGEYLWKFTLYATFFYIMNMRSVELTENFGRKDSIAQMQRDSIIRRRRDSMVHRILDSIIQTKIDSLKNLQLKKAK